MSPRVPHVLVARLDNAGDVLLAGPAIRAVAAGTDRVTLLCGPNGEAAARLLPGVDDVVVHRAQWIDPDPGPFDRDGATALVDRLEAVAPDQAVILTSFHQSALPLALLLRLAGVPTVAAISEDYAGSLLDVRHQVDDDRHEVDRSLSLVATLGYRLPDGDAGRLAVALPPGTDAPAGLPSAPFVVVHPGASVPARTWSPASCAETVDALVDAGWRVVVTGSAAERELTRLVAGPTRDEVVDLGGAVDLAGLAAVLRGAAAAVVGNTGPAHLAAAVGTPVVSLYAPTVPAVRWHPWLVPHVLLGNLGIECRGCRARECPHEDHPCLEGVRPAHVVDAVAELTSRPALAVAR